MENNLKKNIANITIHIIRLTSLIILIFLKSTACGCRNISNTRAYQAHSGNVFKAFYASLEDNPSLTPKSILLYYGNSIKDCRNGSEERLHFGWGHAPSQTLFCTVILSKDKKGFIAIVIGKNRTITNEENLAGSDYYVASVNGN